MTNYNINEINFKNTKICWHSENYVLCLEWILKYTLGTVKRQINWENVHVLGVYQIWSFRKMDVYATKMFLYFKNPSLGHGQKL